MFDDEMAGMPDAAHVGRATTEASETWREIHRQMQRLAARRARLDAEELPWLARAERAELHRHLGLATILEYVERILGYGPKVARERLRVARSIEALPRLAAELAAGRLAYSAVRELTRVATPTTERAWIDSARGRCLREIEDLVRGRKSGDRPEDPVDPDLGPRTVSFELTPATLALLRDATRRLEAELGHVLTDDELVAAMCSAVVTTAPAGDPAATDDACGDDDKDDAAADAGRAPYQIALTICERCDRGWHEAGGRSIEVPASTVEQARCNAQHLGRLDASAPARATQDIPPAVQRLVRRRDRGRCCVTGCRSTRFLQLHHVRFRSAGGDHSPTNIVLVCFGHHQAAHAGKLIISGTAPDRLTFRWHDGRGEPARHDAGHDADRADPVEQAHAALVKLGFRASEARQAIDRAQAHVGRLTLEPLIRYALRELAPTAR